MIAPRIYTCPEWGARQPKQPIRVVGQPNMIIIHHTAGHHRDVQNPGYGIDDDFQYAKDIQSFHMDVNGWIDSGHNFLVTRAGNILQGRWLTVSAIEAGHMVQSAHCPRKNGQPGIEFEHVGDEQLTSAQFHAGAKLIAWISDCYNASLPLPCRPHRRYFKTLCPTDVVAAVIPDLLGAATTYLRGV